MIVFNWHWYEHIKFCTWLKLSNLLEFWVCVKVILTLFLEMKLIPLNFTNFLFVLVQRVQII